jgi:hypothetical protein
MDHDTITSEMSVETLIKILRVQSTAIRVHDATIKALKQRNEELFEAQNILRENIETLRKLLEAQSQLLLRAIPRAGANIEAN